MNQPQAYMDVNQQHGPPPGQAPIAQYAPYGPPQALQPAAHPYTSTYPPYPYPNTMAPMSGGHHVTSSMGQPMVQQSLPLPTMATQPPQAPQAPPAAGGAGAPFDTTGQVAPPGMKPRVTATLWEDEGSLCFQVEANGVCVARREDNHMINGTKLLNVAGMTRGRRDGILKSEKTRHVVKIGPMHLKGVWIPFERALDFANKEKITEMLYPLFVHHIGALLYHPTNQARQSIGNAAMAARRPDQQPPPPPPPAQGNSYEYGAPQNPVMHSGQLPSIEPGMSQSSMPTATAPSPQSVQYHSGGAYDSSRPMYSNSSNFGGYPSQHMQRFGTGIQSSPGSGIKSEMGPPARTGTEPEQSGEKAHDGYGAHPDTEGEHESDYTHNRPIPADGSHVSPEMTHSPHQNGSGRATPRTANTYQNYGTPQRAGQLPSSNLSYVMSNEPRAGGPPNGADPYGQQAYQQAPPQYSTMNGAPAPANSNKRVRELEEDDPYNRPLSAGAPGQELKRQRTDGGPVGGRPISQPQTVKAGGVRR